MTYRSTTSAAALDELANLLPARYSELTPLGQGGMGLVFKALDTQTGQNVAIKVLAGALMAPPSDEARRRFTRESSAISRLSHPFIVNIRHVDDSGPLPFFVMDLAEGETLAQFLARSPEGNIVQGAQICLDICDALSHVHGRGVLHRDLKPENIVIQTNGTIKILDFGLAKLLDDSTLMTGIGQLLGTPAYMAPERLAGVVADPRADLYAVGVILYQFLTGHLPYPADQQYLKALKAPALPSSSNRAVSRSLDALVMNLLDSDPGRRPQSAGELRVRLASSLREYRELETGRPREDDWRELFLGGLERLTGVAPAAAPRVALETGEMREVIQVRVELVQRDRDGAPTVAAFVNDRVLALVAQGLERFGARVERFEPTALVAYIGTKTAGERHLESALAAAFEITQRIAVINGLLAPRHIQLGTRIGLDLVRVRTEIDHSVDETSFGSVDLARCPDGIWMTERMHRRSGGSLGNGRQVGELIEVVNLPLPAVTEAERAPLPRRGSGPLIGRQPEWELLESLRNGSWDELRAGQEPLLSRSRLIAIRGNPGVGKTRLAEEFLRRAGGKRPALMAAAPALVPAPYRIIGDLLRRSLELGTAAPERQARRALEAYVERSGATAHAMSLPALGYLMGLEAETHALEARGASAVRAELLTAVRRLFASWAEEERAAEAGPRIVVLDDLHRVDPASLAAIAAALGTAGPGLFVVACFRQPWDVPESVRRLVDYREINLQPLEPAYAREVLSHVRTSRRLDQEELEKLLRQSGGNPLFLEEMALAVRPSGDSALILASPSVPDHLWNLVASRMDELPVRERELLQFAAVLGTQVDVAVLEAMAIELWGGSPADLALLLERLCVAGFLHETEERHPATFMFRPAVAREVIEASLLESNRRVLHLLALRLLESPDRGTPCDPEILAYHASRTGLAERALHHTLLALKKARARQDVDAMIRLAGEALDWIARSEAPQGADLAAESRAAHRDDVFTILATRELALELSGEVELQRADLAQMMELAQTLADPARQALATVRLARFFWWRLGDPRTAEDLAQRSLELYRGLDDPRGQADAWRVLGCTRRVLGDHERATRHHRQALALYRKAGRPVGVLASLCSLALICADRGRVKYGLALARRAQILEARGDDRSRGQRMRIQGNLLRSAGSNERALLAYGEALKNDSAHGYHRGEVQSLIGMSRTLCALDRPADALDRLSIARAIATYPGARDLECEIQTRKAGILMAAGSAEGLQAAVVCARQAVALADAHRLAPLKVLARSILGRCLSLTGDTAGGLDAAREALGLHRSSIGGAGPAPMLDLKDLEHFGMSAYLIDAARHESSARSAG